MSKHVLEVARLPRMTWDAGATPGASSITSWPISVPGYDRDEHRRRRVRKPARRPLRRGRIQFVAA